MWLTLFGYKIMKWWFYATDSKKKKIIPTYLPKFLRQGRVRWNRNIFNHGLTCFCWASFFFCSSDLATFTLRVNLSILKLWYLRMASSASRTLLIVTNLRQYFSRVMRKPAFCAGENKGADQLLCNRTADLCFFHLFRQYNPSSF